MKSTVSIINMYVVCQHEPRSATKQINNNKQQLCDLLYVTMTLLSLLRLAVPAPRIQPRGCWQLWAALNIHSLVVTRPAVPGASVCNIAVLSITQYSGVKAGG